MGFRKFLFQLLYGTRLPVTSGTRQVTAIQHNVVIRWDNFGVVYIEAENDQDAWFGLGFCHGQDRAYQIENYIRIVRGTLAEVSGPAGVTVDRLSRRIGFYRSALEQMQFLDSDVYEIFNAYANGINSGIEVGCTKSAHEFSLTGTKPTNFTAADALGLFKFMSFGLASNWDVELARLMILREDGPKAVEALDPTYPFWLHVTSPPAGFAGKAQRHLSEDLSILLETTGWHGGGSNSWAVAPERTSTGRAILANDPHLAPVMPPHWYLAQIRTPKWSVAGASFVGTPCFPTGHNDHIAWGMTAGMLDNTDLYIEEMGPDGCSVREGNEYVPCKKHIELINVRDGHPIQEEVLSTTRGPIIGPALEGEVGAISLQAIWLKSSSLKGLFFVHYTKSFDEFKNCFRQWPLLPLNMVYADINGVIGWQLAGEAPKRRKGWGTIPLPGSDPDVGWELTSVDFDKMPFLQKPDAGYVASANNQPNVKCDDPYLGIDWTDGYRITRITEALSERINWDIEKTQKLQIDQVSVPWKEMNQIILSLSTDNVLAKQAISLLRDWNGLVSPDSVGATVFEFFLDEMIQRLSRSKTPKSNEYVVGKCFTPLAPNSMFIGRRVGHLLNLLHNQPEGWFTGSWSEEILKSLETVILRLQKRYGPDLHMWTWGRIRKLTLQHPEGSRKYFGPIFNLGPIAWGGDINTISQAEYTVGDPTSNPTSFASLRAVYDIGNWDECKFALPGGQSGNPLSPHYSDQFPFWQIGDGIPIAWSAERIEKTSISKLHLISNESKILPYASK